MQSTGFRNDINLHFLESGKSSPPVLFLHGLNESLEGYRPVIGHLRKHLHIHVMDFRGHGLSPWSEPYQVKDYALDVIGFIQAQIGESIILAGHSLGGLVATYVVAQQPDLVHGLILEDPPLFTAQMPTLRETSIYPVFIEVRKLLQEHHDTGASAQELEHKVEQWRVGDEGSPSFVEVFGKEFVSRLALELHRSDPRVLDPVLDGTLFEGFDPDQDLSKITCPTHLIAGNYDRGGSMRRQDIKKTTSLIPKCSLAVWEDNGHDIHTMRPSEYSEEVLAFINNINLHA